MPPLLPVRTLTAASTNANSPERGERRNLSPGKVQELPAELPRATTCQTQNVVSEEQMEEEEEEEDGEDVATCSECLSALVDSDDELDVGDLDPDSLTLLVAEAQKTNSTLAPKTPAAKHRAVAAAGSAPLHAEILA